jgi:uncharacterized membrane protein YcaP (DUF421 family)
MEGMANFGAGVAVDGQASAGGRRMFFDEWSGIFRTIVVGTLAYGLLVAVLRTSGKRTLAKMNAFDLVVTVALGSTLATVLLSADVALAEGVTAFALLALLQYLVASGTVRSKVLRGLVKSQPRALVRDGALIEPALRDERVTPEEIDAAVRAAGIGDLGDVAAVVLETDGSFSVIPRAAAGGGSALAGLRSQDRGQS